jgi:serine/threonine protein kinase/Flp pilus assembly protein TadD
MDPERWGKVIEIFGAALDHPLAERETYLRAATDGDAELYSLASRMLQAHVEASGFLETPAIAEAVLQQFAPTPPPLEVGDVLCGRFRIVRLVGEGGMGYVFEALDMEKQETVALKAIRPEIATHTDALRRFYREVDLALKVTHPNVCRTFDVMHDTRILDAVKGTTRQVVFLTMEFLRGETLATRLAREGRLPAEEALPIVRQIASALTAAHQLGIVHRDIKPSNVMLVEAIAGAATPANGAAAQCRAVITDFGLARQDAVFRSEEYSSLSRSGTPMGTLAYMAPEQLQGTATSAATDIYALGLILFETSTGQRAFTANNMLVDMKARMTGAPPLESALVTHLPKRWRRAIEVCLRRKPRERFQAAEDVMEYLDGKRRKLPRVGLATFSEQLTFPSWPLWRRLTALGAVFLAVMSLLYGGLRLYRKLHPPLEAGALVFLPSIQNQTGEKTFDNLTELVQASLAQSTQINLLDQGEVGQILKHMTKSPDTTIDEPIAREIAMRAGADRVVFIRATGSAGSYRLNVDIQQPDNTPTKFRDHWTKSFAWSSGSQTQSATIPAELLTAIRASSDWIRQQVGESRNDIARLDVAPEEVTTSNWEALEDYSNAKRLIVKGDQAAAIRSLEDATKADPGFASAYAELATNLMSIFKTDDALAAYNKAISLQLDGRLSTREKYFIIASHASDSSDMQVAADAFKSYTDLYPNDYLGWFYLYYPLKELDRGDEAIFALKKSLRLHPQGAGTQAAIAVTYLSMGRNRDAERAIQEIDRKQFPDHAGYTSGLEDFLNGNYDQAERDFTELESGVSQVYKAFGYSLLASVLAERGRTDAAVKALDEGVAESARANDRGNLAAQLVDRAYLLCKLHRYQECFASLDLAAAEPVDPYHLVLESFVLGTAAGSGSGPVRAQCVARLQALLALAKKQPDSVIAQIAQDRAAGELDGAKGNWKKAVDEFKAADRLYTPIADRTYLGRALAAAAAESPNQRAAEGLRKEALSAYERTIAHPGRSWHEAWVYLPGFLGDELQAYVDVCSASGTPDETCKSTLSALRSLRGATRGPTHEQVVHR